MFSEKAFELIKELERCPDTMPPFNDDTIRQVLEEIHLLYNENTRDSNSQNTSASSSGIHGSFMNAVIIRHTSIERNKRCLLAYLYNRLRRIRTMRWEFGPILPHDVKANLCEPEIQWFNNYSKSLATYMRSIGDGIGLNIMQDLKPPKSLYIEVRCLVDYGKFELEDGEIIFLKKNSQHFLPRAQCESLIQQGILQHIIL